MNFYQVLTAAVDDLTRNGFDDLTRVQLWVKRLREAATRSLIPEHELRERLASTLGQTYQRLVESGTILERHPDIGRFTLQRVKPQLRSELDRRIAASANLIRLNREQAIESTLRRFQGWASSIPAGGTNAVERVKTKTEIRKSLASLPYEERRVVIDQTHKLTNSLSNLLASEGGAIAAVWHSKYRQPGYHFRPDHKDRDGKIYVIRDNWALKRGLMKLAGRQYTDQLTMPGEEVFCRCEYQYIYNLGSLPSDMLTDLGRESLAEVRRMLAS